ncbi:phage tail tape measure protein [Lactiplantibacillus plantarum]|uniref:phage tail tape measure protein n=1 Tax=Lactiplantibacillus plantarum TaxID=1590 RepID=UPI0021C84FF6|nr:phage tail tape measure protein [Lactiplantibacillus plantarum]
MQSGWCRPKKTTDGDDNGITIKEARKNILAAVGAIVENRTGYTLSSVLNGVDFKVLSQIIEATAEQAQQTANGTHVKAGMMGVNPGNQPVVSLFDFAKKS